MDERVSGRIANVLQDGSTTWAILEFEGVGPEFYAILPEDLEARGISPVKAGVGFTALVETSAVYEKDMNPRNFELTQGE